MEIVAALLLFFPLGYLTDAVTRCAAALERIAQALEDDIYEEEEDGDVPTA